MKKIKVILTLSLALAIFGLNYKLYANESTLSQTEHSIAYEEKYEKEKRKSIKKFNIKENYDMPEEVKDDLNALSNISYLRPKTDSNYEISLAYENGDYTYLDSANTIDEAIEIANNTKNNVKSNVIPSVINKDGLVVYATDAVGRIVKIIDGREVYYGDADYNNYTTTIYKTSTTTYDLTYMNHGFIDDVPIIQDSGNRVKVQVNGLTGWVDKEDDKGVNIISVPINQAKNLSYFTKNDKGSLNHYISYDIENSGSGNIRSIGVAPSFMQLGKKYYSYDCKYFYNSITDLLNDLQNNSHDNAVNKYNPYYNYYAYIPARHKNSYSVEEINDYIENSTPTNSVLRNKGKAIVDAQNKYGVNANLILGIAMNESKRGTSNKAFEKNNIFGLGVYDNGSSKGDTFESVEACIENFAREWMSGQYFNPKIWKYNGSNLGNKAVGINVRYASDPFWGEKAADFIYEMDRYISGEKTLIEYNRHQIGIYKSTDAVKDINGKFLYNIVKDRFLDGNQCAQVGEAVIVLSQSNDKVEMYPDRQVPINEEGVKTYDWNFNGYVNSSSISLINKKEEKQREFTNFTVGNVKVTSSSITGKGVYDATVRAYVDGKQIGDSVVIDTTENFNINIPPQKLDTNIVVEINKDEYKFLQKTIIVRNSEKPTISASDVTIKVGDEFHLMDGVTATDEEDGNITSKIKIKENTVDTSNVGIYKVVYEVEDSNGNTSTKEIIVKVVNYGWCKIDGKWYYYNEDTSVQIGWKDDKGTWYYLKNNGEMATGWEQVGSKWYYLSNSGSMQTGWKDDKGTWYYLRSNGEMATGWEKAGGKWYYLSNSGSMQTGWKDDKGIWYYLRGNGEMATGWEQVGSKWYYLSNSGSMQTGWKDDKGIWYYLRGNGEMATGWEKVGGKWYYLYNSGKMATNTTIDGWKIGSNGVATLVK